MPFLSLTSSVIYGKHAIQGWCIIRCQGSIAIDVPKNVDICCRSTVVYRIENRMNERAVRSECIIGCQGSIEIDVPLMYICTALALSSTKLRID